IALVLACVICRTKSKRCTILTSSTAQYQLLPIRSFPRSRNGNQEVWMLFIRSSGWMPCTTSVFPDTEVNDLKPVYRADTLDLAGLRMDELQDKWGEKYPVVIDSWRRNWDRLTTYFRYDKSIRKLIYTTNTIEGFHRQVRKVTKTKGAFTSDMALLKLIYLAHKNIKKKWT